MIVAGPSVSFRSFGVAKAGNSDAEWEDAAAHSETTNCFAVADGAASAYHAGLWSHLLAGGFLRDPFAVAKPEEFAPWLARRAQEWHRATRNDGDAPYYVRAAQERGSHATFLGVEVHPDSTWSALAVGDACLLQYRAGELVESFPMSDPDAFGFQPDLVATDADSSMLATRRRGRLEVGDTLLGVSDAAAEWLLRSRSDPHGPATAIFAATGELDELVIAAREAGTLRNDDVVIVRACIGDRLSVGART